MCRWRRRRFEVVTVALLCIIVYSNLPLSSALFGWLRGRKKVVSHSAAQLDDDSALDAEEAGDELARSPANRGPDGCGHKLKAALGVVKAYGASFKHWHWPWRKKKKAGKDSKMHGGRKSNLDGHLRVIDHCAAIAEREEYQRGHFDNRQRRRQRRWARDRRLPLRQMDDKRALRTLTRMLKRKSGAPLSAADHWAHIGVIRWGRRAIRDIRRRKLAVGKAFRRRKKQKNGKAKKNLRQKGGRRMKRGGDEEEDETSDDDEGGRASSSDEEDGNGTKFKYTKTAHGYSRDRNAGSDAKDQIYETVSFEAEHPHKGRYTQRTMTEYKFHGPKHSEWRHRPPKPPKAAAEGRAWTGTFKSRRRGANGRHSERMSRGGRKSRHGRWRRKRNWADDYGGDYYYYTVAHPMPYSSYGHYYGPRWYAYAENYYHGGGDAAAFGYGGAAEEGGFMPSGALGAAMKMVGIVLFVILLIIII